MNMGGGGPQPGGASRSMIGPGGDPFPLPLLQEGGAACKHSRRSMQRLARRRQEFDMINDGIRTLNWMAGCPSSATFTPSALQEEIVERVVKLAKESFKLDAGFSSPPTSEAALAELLHGASEYAGSVTTLAAYDRERISMPESLENSPNVEDLLPADARHFLEAPERMVNSSSEFACDIVPYWDPVLRRSSREYRHFIQYLDKIGYLDYTQTPQERAGVFFVHKSDKKKIRLIIDGRRANARLKEPPGVSLATAEAFSRIEMETAGEGEHPGEVPNFEEVRVHVGLSDVKDCFHRMRQPRWLREFFALDPIPARWVGRGGTDLEGNRLEPDTLIFPMPMSLCMGCSWSLFFAQKANENLLQRSRSLESSRPVTDRSDPIVIRVADSDGRPSTSCDRHYVYVDNLGIISSDESRVQSGLTEATQLFEGQGLLLHAGEIESEEINTLGCRLDGRRHCTGLKRARFHKVRQALKGILKRGTCTGRLLEVLVGHLTYSFLIARPLLSILHHTYRYIQRHYYQKARLWDSVREELEAAVGGLIFCEADWCRPWNRVVGASDASLSGYGVCTSEWTLADVQAAGRVPERERFRRRGPHSARESALEEALISSEKDFDPSLPFDLSAGWDSNAAFPEIKAALLAKDKWEVKLMGRWSYSEGIFELESLALLKSLVRFSRTRFGRDVRQLLLVDNMSVALAFSRFRSRNFRVLKIIRKFGAWCLGRNVSATVRWIPSELNSADGPSRNGAEEKDSHPQPTWPEHLRSREEGPGAEWRANRGSFKDGENAPNGRPALDSVDAKTSGLHPSIHRGGLTRSAYPGGQAGGSRKFVLEHLRSRRRSKESDAEGKAADPKGQGETSPTEVPRHRFREQEGRHHALGVPSGVSWSSGVLQEGTARPAHREAEGLGLHNGRRRRPCHRRVHERLLLERGAGAQGGEGPGGANALQARVRKNRVTEAAPLMEGPQRVAQAHPSTQQAAASIGSVGSRVLRATASRFYQDGCVCDGGSEFLRPTRRTLSLHSLLFGGPDGKQGPSLEPPDVARAPRSARQDRRVRHECDFGLFVPATLVPRSLPFAEAPASNHAAMGFRLRQLHQGVSRRGRRAPPSNLAVPDATFGPQHRSSSQLAQPTRCAEARGMEECKVSHAVREVGPPGSRLPGAAAGHARPLPVVRRTSRGCRPGPAASKAPSMMPKHRHRYFLDLFSGAGGVSRRWRGLGFRAFEFELEHGPESDLTNPAILRKVLSCIKAGETLGGMLAPPCFSFSVAKDRAGVTRTSQAPWGVDSLPTAERQRLAVGNACARSAIRVIRELDRLHLPWCLENPESSKLWFLPALQRLLRMSHVHAVTIDFCQYGSPWRKRTKLVFGNLDRQDTLRLCHRRCAGPPGWCSRTGRRHARLSGRAPDGRPRTAVAQPYPPQLCADLSFVLSSPYLTTDPTTLWFTS